LGIELKISDFHKCTSTIFSINLLTPCVLRRTICRVVYMYVSLGAGVEPVSQHVTFWLLSFVVGVLVGLTSMGGAALVTPFLILFIGLRPVIAIGTDLVYSAFTKVAGAWMHWRQGTVDMRIVLRLATGSVPGGLAGVFLVHWLRTGGIDPDPYLRRAIGVVLLLVASLLLFRSFRIDSGLNHIKLFKRHDSRFAILWGAVVGFAVGLTSVGSGSLIAPFLLLSYPMAPARVVGTDVFHAAILVSATALLYANVGHVEWKLLPVLLTGSIPGVLLGSYIAPRLPARSLRLGLSVVLLVTGAKLV